MAAPPVVAAHRFAFVPQVQNDTFEDVGFGPFTVRRVGLLNDIIQAANPKKSVHISGCKGAGKTTVLHQLGQCLTDSGKEVYFFRNASQFNMESVSTFIEDLANSNREVYLLVDETQENPSSHLFTLLLKNNTGHKITTIGAGVPKFESISGSFKHLVTTERLFLSSDEMLESEGVLEYFTQSTTSSEREQIRVLLCYIRDYVCGHIYPLMWLAEHLVPRIKSGDGANTTIEYLHSEQFSKNPDLQAMKDRILPSIQVQIFRGLLLATPDPVTLNLLQKHGFSDKNNRIISQLLFDTYVQSLTGNEAFPDRLSAGIAGAQQLLQFSMPNIRWDQYNGHGGPIEDSMTFELLLLLSRVAHLDTRLFNPKLVNFAAGRKPDLYLNSTIDAYIECVLTTANSPTERKKLDEHISRFYWEKYDKVSKRIPPAYYQISESDFAILNYQSFGTQPMQPWESYFQGQIFEERVFTFVMPTKELFKGSVLIASPSTGDHI